MQVSVIGCGRWGSFIAWYLAHVDHEVTLYGRAESARMQEFLKARGNALLTLPQSVLLCTDLAQALSNEIVVISIGAQGLEGLMEEIAAQGPKNKTFVLCMKGLIAETGMRLSEVAKNALDASNAVAVWLGPGHVQEFLAGVPNCMVIDSENQAAKQRLVELFSNNLIRFYYGQDLLGNEIGAASKNVIGVAAGMLDGLGLSTLKGALASRGTHEISRLIDAMGGNPFSAYGLCHLGDYGATVFSPYSHNRRFGEAFVKGEPYTKLAEGVATTRAMVMLGERFGVELPICAAVYHTLYENVPPRTAIDGLFARTLKGELFP